MAQHIKYNRSSKRGRKRGNRRCSTFSDGALPIAVREHFLSEGLDGEEDDYRDDDKDCRDDAHDESNEGLHRHSLNRCIDYSEHIFKDNKWKEKVRDLVDSSLHDGSAEKITESSDTLLVTLLTLHQNPTKSLQR